MLLFFKDQYLLLGWSGHWGQDISYLSGERYIYIYTHYLYIYICVCVCVCVCVYMDFPGGSDGRVSVYNVRDLGSIPGFGRFPGEGNGNPLQYSCLENPMDKGAWCRLLSMGSQKSQARLHFHFHIYIFACLVTQSCLTFYDPLDCIPPGFSVQVIFQQEYWNGLPFPTPGDLSDPGTEPMSPVSPALHSDSLPTDPSGKPHICITV